MRSVPEHIKGDARNTVFIWERLGNMISKSLEVEIMTCDLLVTMLMDTEGRRNGPAFCTTCSQQSNREYSRMVLHQYHRSTNSLCSAYLSLA